MRARTSTSGLLRSRVDVLVLGFSDVPLAGMRLRRVVVRAEGVHVRPGLPARLRAAPVGAKLVVDQEGVDSWAAALRTPVKVRLVPEGVLLRAGVGGLRLGEVLARVEVRGRFVQLTPVQPAVSRLPAPVAGLLKGYLPLPALPRSAEVRHVEPGDGELAVFLTLPDVDEALTPRFLSRLRKGSIGGLWPIAGGGGLGLTGIGR